MTLLYVSDNLGGAGDAGTETDPWRSLFSAVAGSSAGDIILVDHTHNEEDKELRSWIFPGTPELPIRVISVDYGDSYAYRIGAEVRNSSGTQDYTLSQKNVTFEGVVFIAPDAFIMSGDSTYFVHRDANFGGARDSSGVISGATDAHYLRLENVDLETQYLGYKWSIGINDWAVVDWIGGSILSAQSTLVAMDSGCRGVFMDIRGVNLSQLTRVMSEEDFSSSAMPIFIKLVGCQLKSGFEWNNGSGRGSRRMRLEAYGCDESADLAAAAYKYLHYQRAGESESVATHYRTGGAEFRGVGYSQRMTAVGGYTVKANDDSACWIDIAVPVTTADAAMEARVHIAHMGIGSGTDGVLETDEVWLTRLSPSELATETAQLTYVTSRPVYGAAIDPLPTSTESWTDDNSPDLDDAAAKKQYISTGSFTPTIEGIAYFRLFFATGHATIDYDIYVCTKPEII